MPKYAATTADKKCVFCEIVAGNLKTPGVFWEDTQFMAWLAIDPNTEGFSCVIPKTHFGSAVLRMPDIILQQFILAAKKVAHVLERHFTDVGRVGLIMEGTGIDHAHIKLIPMHGTGFMKQGEWKQVLSGKEFWFDTYPGWISSGSGPLANPDELARLATAIKQEHHE